jgi:hypothetical protein
MKVVLRLLHFILFVYFLATKFAKVRGIVESFELYRTNLIRSKVISDIT